MQPSLRHLTTAEPFDERGKTVDMAHTNVASCVISIVGSFSNGLDVFKRLRERRQKKKRSKKEDLVERQELRLDRSLRQGQEDIGREYQNSVHIAGDQFAIGDTIAQTSLAETLLRLNTGLVSIIASFVNSNKNNVQLDYRSLTDISERSRIDTCRALRQLFKRMSLKPQLPITAKEDEPTGRRKHTKHSTVGNGVKRRKGSEGYTKVRAPMLARVVIADSSKPSQVAMVRPGERRKRSTSSTGSGSSSLSKAPSGASTTVTNPLPTPPPEYTLDHVPRPVAPRSNTAPEAPKPRRKHSATNVKNFELPSREEPLRATRSTPRLPSTLSQEIEPRPSIPDTAPLPATPVSPPIPRRQRRSTPTYYSIASDSTKLGEIPLHKWAVPYDFDQASILNKEAYDSGWPLNQLNNQQNQRKRFRILGLFGRKST